MADVAVSLIHTALQTGYYLWEWGFNHENSADESYRKLKKLISNSFEGLKQLEKILPQAIEVAYDDECFDLNGSQNAEVHLSDQLKILLQDYEFILQKCDTLLKPYAVTRGGSRFVQNLVWNWNDKKVFDEKLWPEARGFQDSLNSMLLQVSLRLTLNTNTSVQQLLTGSIPTSQLTGPSFDSYPIPDFLAVLFAQDSLPPDYTRLDLIPPEYWLKTIRFHLGASTLGAQSSSDDYLQRYINLLKSQWMMMRLTRVRNFQDRQEIPLRLRAQKMQQKILSELSRNDLPTLCADDIIHDDDRRLDLRLWEHLPQSYSSDAFMPLPGEQRVLDLTTKLSFTNPAIRICAFRKLSSPRDISLERDGKRERGCKMVDIDVIPTFAYDKAQPNTLTIRLPYESDPVRHSFGTAEEVYPFQWAMTNYAVASDIEGVTLILEKRPGNKDKKFVGRVMMLVWNPNHDAEKFLCGPENSDDSLLYSLSRQPSIASRRTEHQGVQEANLTLEPYAPILLFLGKCDEVPMNISMEVKKSFSIDPSLCKCSREPQECTSAVISNNRDKIEVVKATSKERNGYPSLSIYSRPSCLQGPERHFPHRRGSENLEPSSPSGLTFRFSDIKNREKFTEHFSKVVSVRKADFDDYSELLTQNKFYAENPLAAAENDRRRSSFLGLRRYTTGSSIRSRTSKDLSRPGSCEKP